MFKIFLNGFPQAFLRTFTWWHIVLGAVAGVLTYLCVVSGFDWYYYLHTRGVFVWALPAALLGFFVPILAPVLLYLYGWYAKKQTSIANSVLLAQAAMLGWFLSSLIKVFTGRIQPEFYTHLVSVNTSHLFNFGIWRHGIFWGWPSSHTTVAVAMSFVAAHIWRKYLYVIAIVVVYAAYIALGVSVSIHWFSDALAGVIFGYIAARAVLAKRN